MKAVKLIPIFALAFVLLAVPMVQAADASDDVAMDFGAEAADISFADEEETPPTSDWYGYCFLIIFIIAMLISVYYGFIQRD